MKLTVQQEENLKTVAYVGAAGLLVYFVFVKRKENSGSSVDPTGNGSYTPTLPTFNAKIVAENLYDAMKDTGTDEESILETLKTVSPTQFGQVIIAFGNRSYNTLTGNQYNFNPFSPLPKLPLKAWLKEELETKDYALLRAKYPNHL